MKESVMNTVSELRLSHEWTQQELAEKLDISRQTVIAIEKGHYTPSVLLALKVAKCFKKSVHDIFTIVYEK